MVLDRVFYSRKGTVFHVESGNNKYIVANDEWDAFLDQYGTNPKSDGKRIAGSDSVDRVALTTFLNQLDV